MLECSGAGSRGPSLGIAQDLAAFVRIMTILVRISGGLSLLIQKVFVDLVHECLLVC